jgi:hypothetical protein
MPNIKNREWGMGNREWGTGRIKLSFVVIPEGDFKPITHYPLPITQPDVKKRNESYQNI